MGKGSVILPIGGSNPDGVLFKLSGLTSQRTSYGTAPNDDGDLTTNGFYTSIVTPAYPKVIAQLDLAEADYFLRMKDNLVVDGVSNKLRFRDVDGGQTFAASDNKDLVFLDCLTGYMWYRAQSDFTSRNFEDSLSFADSHSVSIDGVTYDDWVIPTSDMFKDILPREYSSSIVDGAVTIFTPQNGMATSSTDLGVPANYMRITNAGFISAGKAGASRTFLVRKAHNLITAP